MMKWNIWGFVSHTVIAGKNRISSPLISMVIPVWNGGEYYKELLNCLRRQLSQSVKVKDSVEIILSLDSPSDGSTEESEKFQKEFPDNVILVYHDNTGLIGNRNIGISVARGEYLMFSDHDDSLPDHSFSKAIELLNREQPDIINFRAEYISAKGEVVNAMPHIDRVEKCGKDYMLSPVLNIGTLWDNIIRRSLITDNHLYSEKYWLSEDACCRTKAYLAAKGKVVGVDDVLYQWRVFDSSTSHKAASQIWKLDSSTFYLLHYLNYSIKQDNHADKKFWQKVFARQIHIVLRQKGSLRKVDFPRKKLNRKVALFRRMWLRHYGLPLDINSWKILLYTYLIPMSDILISGVDWMIRHRLDYWNRKKYAR